MWVCANLHLGKRAAEPVHSKAFQDSSKVLQVVLPDLAVDNNVVEIGDRKAVEVSRRELLSHEPLEDAR